MDKIFSLVSGIIFGVGLMISGMTNPEKVIGFLSITPQLGRFINLCNGWWNFVYSAFLFFITQEKQIISWFRNKTS